jgi:hypothetical protein
MGIESTTANAPSDGFVSQKSPFFACNRSFAASGSDQVFSKKPQHGGHAVCPANINPLKSAT